MNYIPVFLVTEEDIVCHSTESFAYMRRDCNDISVHLICVLFIGIYSVLTPVMAVDLVGVDHMGTVMSLGLMIAGLIVLTMVPFAGKRLHILILSLGVQKCAFIGICPSPFHLSVIMIVFKTT